VCDDCREREEIIDMLDLPDDDDDSIERAKMRLRCYYKCVTRAPDIFAEEDDESV
jgi:hypothetical protein